MVREPEKDTEYKILKEDELGLMKSFTERFKNELGPESNESIKEDRDTIREQRQRLKEAENQIDAKIDAIQNEYCSKIESEAELRRMKQLKKNYQTDLENKKKALDSLSKKARNIEKE